MKKATAQKLFVGEDITASVVESGFVFVDSVYGNDSTGKLNQRLSPFKTISAAANLAKAQTKFHTVVVRPGTYLESNNLLGNCNYYFEPGSVVENISTSPLFSDVSTGAGTFSIIKGFAKFISRTRITNVGGVITSTTAGPVFRISNPKTQLNISCGEIQSTDVEAIWITDCYNFSIECSTGMLCNGSVYALRVSGRIVNITSPLIQGSANGIVFSCWSGGINSNIQLSNAEFTVTDFLLSNLSPDIDQNEQWGVQYFNCNAFRVKVANFSCTQSDLRIKIHEADVEQSFTVATLTGASLVTLPTLFVECTRLKSLNCIVQCQKGHVTFSVPLLLDLTGEQAYNGTSELVPGTGTFVVEGSDAVGTNATTLVKINKLVVDKMYLGQNASNEAKHGTGLLDTHIDLLQCNQYYLSTKLTSSTLKRFLPRLHLSGLEWRGQGYAMVQTLGVIDIGVSQMRETVVNGGVLTIQDRSATASENAGLIRIHDCLIKNENTAQGTPTEVLTPIYCPSSCNAILTVNSTVLSVGLSTTDAAVSDNRFIEPIYPIENFVSPPLLSICSYRNLTTSLPGDTSSTPTRWSGNNTNDPLYVLV